jgi:uncharacterized protein (TIGR04255 family)
MSDTFPIRIPDRLPKKVEPCPILETIFEIRFQSNVPAQAILGLVYQQLRIDFPQVRALPLAGMPEESVQANPALLHQPHYRLEGEKFVVLVGPRSVATGTRGKYPGWDAVLPGFAAIFRRIFSTDLIMSPERFGLRYINYFPGDVLDRLAISFLIQDQPIQGSETFFKTIMNWGSLRTIVQVGKDVTVANQDITHPTSGSVIDIDCFQLPTSRNSLNAAIGRFLETAHTAEKQLFFSLLKPDFLEEFNPKY